MALWKYETVRWKYIYSWLPLNYGINIKPYIIDLCCHDAINFSELCEGLVFSEMWHFQENLN